MDRLKFRLATLDDKNEILNIIPGSFFRIDPICSRFERYFSNKYRFHFLAELEGKVVSFLGLKVIDGGRSVYYYAAKTHDDYTNLRIQTNLLKFGVNYLKEREFPEIERVFLLTVEPQYNDEYFKTSKLKILIHQENKVCLTINVAKFAAEILPTWRQRLISNLKTLPPEEISQKILRGQMKFENDIFFVDYHSCNALVDNSELICELVENSYFVSEEDIIESFSSITSYEKKNGTLRPRFDIDVNCENTARAIEHCVRHIDDVILFIQNGGHYDEVEIIMRFCNKVSQEKMCNFFLNETTEGIVRHGAIPMTHWKSRVLEVLGII